MRVLSSGEKLENAPKAEYSGIMVFLSESITQDEIERLGANTERIFGTVLRVKPGALGAIQSELGDNVVGWQALGEDSSSKWLIPVGIIGGVMYLSKRGNLNRRNPNVGATVSSILAVLAFGAAGFLAWKLLFKGKQTEPPIVGPDGYTVEYFLTRIRTSKNVAELNNIRFGTNGFETLLNADKLSYSDYTLLINSWMDKYYGGTGGTTPPSQDPKGFYSRISASRTRSELYPVRYGPDGFETLYGRGEIGRDYYLAVYEVFVKRWNEVPDDFGPW